MNKIFIISGLFLIICNCSIALEDETPLFFPQTGAVVEYSSNENSLINVDNLKRAQKVERAKEESAKKSSPRVKLDIEQINHQRALNYTTRQNNSLLRAF